MLLHSKNSLAIYSLTRYLAIFLVYVLGVPLSLSLSLSLLSLSFSLSLCLDGARPPDKYKPQTGKSHVLRLVLQYIF